MSTLHKVTISFFFFCPFSFLGHASIQNRGDLRDSSLGRLKKPQGTVRDTRNGTQVGYMQGKCSDHFIIFPAPENGCFQDLLDCFLEFLFLSSFIML